MEYVVIFGFESRAGYGVWYKTLRDGWGVSPEKRATIYFDSLLSAYCSDEKIWNAIPLIGR